MALIQWWSKVEKVYADKNMVKSILRNLMNNAIKYSFEHGHIDIMSKKEHGFLELTIKDYGVGIDEKLVNTLSSAKNSISSFRYQWRSRYRVWIIALQRVYSPS